MEQSVGDLFIANYLSSGYCTSIEILTLYISIKQAFVSEKSHIHFISGPLLWKVLTVSAFLLMSNKNVTDVV